MITKSKNGKKVPRCVEVYNKLFEMIKNKEFSLEEKLPTEPELAKKMNVSRTTLRQAIELLQEDGIIKSIQGKGNFIIQTTELKMEKGLECINNPVYSIIDDEIIEVELEFKIDVSTDYMTKVFEREVSIVLLVDRWYKTKDKVIAYTLSFIPAETVLEAGIKLTDKEEILRYLETKIYEEVNFSDLSIKVSEVGNISSTKYKITDSGKCHLLAEVLYNKSNYPIIYNKHYIPLEEGTLRIYRKYK